MFTHNYCQQNQAGFGNPGTADVNERNSVEVVIFVEADAAWERAVRLLCWHLPRHP